MAADVLAFWFAPDTAGSWFLAASPARDGFDALVIARFSGVLAEAESGALNGWFEQGAEGATALVIVLDQFSRHAYRTESAGAEKIATLNAAACAWTTKAVHRGDAAELRGPMLSFLLMPWRHEQPVRPERLERILDLVSAEEDRAIADKSVLSRFKRATEARLAEAPKEGKRAYGDADVLEVGLPSPVPGADATTHAVYKAISASLKLGAEDAVVVSLSGGVDSMVITQALCYLRGKRPFTLAAAHVNYGNRGASDQEADFVRRWCEARGVRFFCSRVGDHVLRGVTNRDEYELKSRQARFELYRQVWTRELNRAGVPQVLLGHHRDDVTENVLSNAMKGKTILELSGMKAVNVIDGCAIRRPLLALEKRLVFDFAHAFGVPYFKDTTPRWSTRGQVRNELLPLLGRVYGEGWRAHLANLARQSDELDDAMQGESAAVVVKPSPAAAFCVDMAHVAARPTFMWRLVLRRAAHESGVLAPTDKAVASLVQHLARAARVDARGAELVELRSEVTAFVVDARYLVVLPAGVEGSRAVLGVGATSSWAAVGPWRVEVREDDVVGGGEYVMNDDEIWAALAMGRTAAARAIVYRTRRAAPGAAYEAVIEARLKLRRAGAGASALASASGEPRMAGLLLPLVRATAVDRTRAGTAVVRCTPAWM